MSRTKFANDINLVPDVKWKAWTYKNLASSQNLWVTDIDSFIRSREGCFILVDKRKNTEVKIWQKLSIGLLATLLKQAEGSILKPNEYLVSSAN